MCPTGGTKAPAAQIRPAVEMPLEMIRLGAGWDELQ